eukprot:CAMPEP_0197055386 /NCGR_PEP_ID=MMETSP1384-20130603/64099_1 /TAXON_ID=29189 /ORGANISM="Ammonia sp." /LENGTH=324 /DNA_ID=CAMNT_0042488951 /DNA_START=119 /DNA_END=1093 /DNA_ORIENTATION=-
MGTVFSAFTDRSLSPHINENDPKHVMVAPNLSGFNRIVISLPPNVSIDDILQDLVDNDYLNGTEEHDVGKDNHYIIKRESEQAVNECIAYLNNKWGFIAHKAYIKPSRNIVVDASKYGVSSVAHARSSHIALIHSPDGQNPNEQFSAFRREYDIDTEFPKFERVDIEDAIHYTRPDELAKNMAQRSDAHNAMLLATNALSAMSKGQQFDINETQVVKDREAVKIDYVEKIRKLRNELNASKKRKMKNKRFQQCVCQQFKFDHMNKLIELKRKKYGINRAKRIYEMQRQQRLMMAKMKQEIDPNIQQSRYNRQQQAFWEAFDHTK